MRLCLLHGFTQTGASWEPVARRLRARGHEVLTPDAPGHGTASTDRSTLPEAAAAVAAQIGRATWVGYSMGGRLALHVALARPDVVERLVLVSTTAGIQDPDERAARRQADEALAAQLQDQGVDAFLDRWLDTPLFATLPRERAGIEHRRANTADGLASSLRLAGTGAQDPLWDRLPLITATTLVITGGGDQRFTSLGRRLAADIPHATQTIVPHAGHAVPWEDPDAFTQELLSQG